MTSAARTAVASMVAATLVAVAGCGSSGEGDTMDQATGEKVADQARGYIDELAAMLGEDPQVQQDVLTACVPEDEDSGKELDYGLRVATRPGARDRLLTEIRQKWESRGWTAKTGGATDLRLLKSSFSMGATVSSDGTRASVGGSGGCVDQVR